MPRFKVGDRVQLTGDIARFHTCVIGVVIPNGGNQASVLSQFKVRLADGVVATFFDFQLTSPPEVRAYVSYDSAVKEDTGTRGPLNSRHVYFVAAGIEIHLRIAGSHNNRSLIGQVAAGKTPTSNALITLLSDEVPIETKPTDEAGEFGFDNVKSGEITIEAFVPGKRILATVTI